MIGDIGRYFFTILTGSVYVLLYNKKKGNNNRRDSVAVSKDEIKIPAFLHKTEADETESSPSSSPRLSAIKLSDRKRESISGKRGSIFNDNMYGKLHD